MSIVTVDKNRTQAKNLVEQYYFLFLVAYITTVITLIFSFYLVFLIAAAPIRHAILSYKANLDLLNNLVLEDVEHTTAPWLEYVWYPRVLLPLALCIVAIICLTAVVKFRALKRKGGAAVAYSLGATEIVGGEHNPQFQMVSNVVEEMAIAAGISPPRVFVLEREPGINAFASGFTIQKAAICITQGCIDKLNRNELQSIVAHEFGHIVNGDTGFNSWLYIVLNSLLVVYITIRKFVWKGGKGSTINPNESSLSYFTLLAMILNLFARVSGYAGLFFSQAIQAAVARQSEFLADVAAVKLTRNPRSLCSALWKISKAEGGSQLVAPQAEAVCHMFFCSSLDDGSQLFETHPPIVARIRAIVSYFPEEQAKLTSSFAGEN